MNAIKPAVVLIGVGEMGGVFARGLLRAGYPVYPAGRDTDLADLAVAVPDPELVLVAVGERDLHSVLERLPSRWREPLALLQNELLPNDWQSHGLEQPTVTSVWFEKKPGREAKVIQPTPVFGPRSAVLEQALTAIGIPVKLLPSAARLLHELVLKNLYILTTNIAGLKVGGTVGELWSEHRSQVCAIADEVLDIQQASIGQPLDRPSLIDAMVLAFKGDLDHGCLGRSAPARLARALRHADEHRLELSTLRAIGATQGA